MKNEPGASDDGYSDIATPLDRYRRQPFLRKENVLWAVFFAVLLAITVGISAGVAALVVLNWQSQGPSCLEQTTSPSPVTRDIDISYHVQQFNGSFMQENIYRQPGSPEVDEAWEALGVNCG
jgi:hypothetical protein